MFDCPAWMKTFTGFGAAASADATSDEEGENAFHFLAEGFDWEELGE